MSRERLLDPRKGTRNFDVHYQLSMSGIRVLVPDESQQRASSPIPEAASYNICGDCGAVMQRRGRRLVCPNCGR